MSEPPWVWFKAGDHVDEGRRLCQQWARETGRQDAAEKMQVRLVSTPSSAPVTLLLADGPWWREQMKAQSNGWRGVPLDLLEREFMPTA